MFQKLFSLIKNECALESQDNLMNQEILTPGALYLNVIKVCIMFCSLNILNNSFIKENSSLYNFFLFKLTYYPKIIFIFLIKTSKSNFFLYSFLQINNYSLVLKTIYPIAKDGK